MNARYAMDEIASLKAKCERACAVHLACSSHFNSIAGARYDAPGLTSMAGKCLAQHTVRADIPAHLQIEALENALNNQQALQVSRQAMLLQSLSVRMGLIMTEGYKVIDNQEPLSDEDEEAKILITDEIGRCSTLGTYLSGDINSTPVFSAQNTPYSAGEKKHVISALEINESISKLGETPFSLPTGKAKQIQNRFGFLGRNPRLMYDENTRDIASHHICMAEGKLAQCKIRLTQMWAHAQNPTLVRTARADPQEVMANMHMDSMAAHTNSLFADAAAYLGLNGAQNSVKLRVLRPHAITKGARQYIEQSRQYTV